MFTFMLISRFIFAMLLLYSIITICQDEKVVDRKELLALPWQSSSPADWLENPCGVLHHRQTRSSNGVVDYSAAFLLQMLIALTKMQNWIDDFTEMRFRMSFDEKEVEDEGMHYTWLLIGSVHPLLSIKINDHSSSQQILLLDNMDGFLIVAQEILKRFAVAWDYITVENDRDFNSQFRETKTANIMILCELDALVMARADRTKSTLALADLIGFKPNDTLVFPQVLRDLRYDSDRSTRNFRIIKDYVRALHFFIDQYWFLHRRHFRTHLP